MKHQRNPIKSYPDFIGIGAQKSATTWLYSNLKKHPEVWMPPEKELHYFSRSVRYPSRSHLACSHFLPLRFLWPNRANRSYQYRLFKSFSKVINNFSLEKTAWYFNYFFGAHDDQWYASLFPDKNTNIIRGEITPAYSILKLEDVKHISEIMPNLKVIFFMRNPIDRMWSHIRYEMTKNSYNDDLKNLTPEEIIKKYTNEEGSELRTLYSMTLKNWKTCFPEDQLFIGFYDEVVENPKEILSRLYKFLEIESSSGNLFENISQRVNVSNQAEMPQDLKTFFSQKYFSEIQEVNNMVGSYTNRWLVEVQSHLELLHNSSKIN
jgi:hypothetical protein